MNNSNPQTVVRISNKTQAYVLNVKELSMELGEATESVLSGDTERLSEGMEKMAETFNDSRREVRDMQSVDVNGPIPEKTQKKAAVQEEVSTLDNIMPVSGSESK